MNSRPVLDTRLDAIHNNIGARGHLYKYVFIKVKSKIE